MNGGQTFPLHQPMTLAPSYINLPECAILSIGRIMSEPAVHNGQIVPREMRALSPTFDHRGVGGGPAARFLDTVREFVKEPYLWLVR